jgi:hypothetical protein
MFFHRKKMLRFESLLRENNPEYSEDIIQFLVLRETVATVINDSFMWFLRWVYDQERIEWFHYQTWRFVNTGAIHPELRYGAMFLNYNPDTPDTLIMMTRGSSKTSFFQNGWALWKYYRSPESKFLLVGGNEDKVTGSLKSIRKDITRPYLNLVAPDKFARSKKEYILRGGKITKREIDLENTMVAEMVDEYDITVDNRKEATFTIASPRIDRTSWHFDETFVDDLVIEETSKTQDAVDKANTYRQNLMGLAHDARDWAEHYTGTEWYEGSTYHYIRGEITSIVLPAKYSDEKGNVIYMSKFVGEKELQKASLRMKEDMPPQYLMLPKPREKTTLDLGFDSQQHVLDIETFQLERMKQTSVIIQVGDPAYSKKNKREGDGKSRATILHVLRDRERTYLYDVWQSFGEDTDVWTNINLDHARKHNIEYFIQDAQATQGGLFESMKKRMLEARPYMRFFKHTASPLTNTTDKVAIANGVLQNYFALGEILVLRCIDDPAQQKRIEIVIKQLAGQDPGLDIVDCLVYAQADVNIDLEYNIAMSNKRNSARKRNSRKIGWSEARSGWRVGA